MQLVAHGGGCCGINHIYGFGMNPDGLVSKLEENGIPTGRVMFHEIPEEKAVERLHRYLEFIDENECAGVVEVTLVANVEHGDCDCPDCRKGSNDNGDKSQSDIWEPVIIPLGFVNVTEFFNPNSDNTVRVYHRAID